MSRPALRKSAFQLQQDFIAASLRELREEVLAEHPNASTLKVAVVRDDDNRAYTNGLWKVMAGRKIIARWRDSYTDDGDPTGISDPEWTSALNNHIDADSRVSDFTVDLRGA